MGRAGTGTPARAWRRRAHLHSRHALRGHLAPRLTASSDCVECAKLRDRERQPIRTARKSAATATRRAVLSLRPWGEIQDARQRELAAGETLFFTGIPCVRGHIAPRRVDNGGCCECGRLRSRSSYITNKHRFADAMRAATAKRRARMAAVGGTVTTDDIEMQLELQGYRCANPFCGVDVLRLYHQDHIIPIVSGGSNSPDNIQILCPPCNLRKGRRPWEKYLALEHRRTVRGW
jgi:5-methylcytosine-specific restriction endonuclease McrA